VLVEKKKILTFLALEKRAVTFLGDDKEFIGAIKEAKDWGSGFQLRMLFVGMLLSAVMDRPCYVWDETKVWLADGVLYKQRKIANNRGITC
jgi:hypothetical protein